MTNSTIDRAAAIMLYAGTPSPGGLRTTWGDFLETNAEALGETEVARIERDLLKPGCTAFGGGGASAEWSIRLLIGDEA